MRLRPVDRRLPRVCGRALSLSARRTLAEPGDLIVAGVLYLLVTIVLTSLWRAAAVANDGNILGYSATALVWYIATTETGIISMPQRLIEDIGNDIGSHKVEIEMLRPAAVLPIRLASVLGAVLPRSVVCALLGIGVALTTGGVPPNTWALLLALPSLGMAMCLNLLAQHLFASAAFWVLDAKGAWFLYQKIVFLLGGMLLPLEVLPDGMATVAKATPFPAMAYMPGRLAAGYFEPELLLIQAAWVVAIGGGAALFFRAGQRHLTEVGA